MDNLTTQSNPSSVPTSKASDTARFTPQQQREMGVTDDKGHTVQPSGAFVLIALTYVFVAGVALAVVAIIMHFWGGGGGASAAGGQ